MLTGAIKRLFTLVRPTISGVLTAAGTITRKIITSRAVKAGIATFAGQTSYVITDFPDILSRAAGFTSAGSVAPVGYAATAQ